MRSKFAGSKDDLLLDNGFDAVFWTLNEGCVGEAGSGREFTRCRGIRGADTGVLVPQWHACFLGIAAVTPPQLHG